MSGSLYVLRHEERHSNDISFDSPLTDSGHVNARSEVCGKLASVPIDTIYCSPYLRTLQTIAPFCEERGLRVNLDWSVAECMDRTAKYYPQFDAIVNQDYTSFTPYQADAPHHTPHFQELVERVEPFLHSLSKSQNILLVTHLPIMNVILHLKGFRDVQLYSHRAPGTVIKIDRV